MNLQTSCLEAACQHAWVLLYSIPLDIAKLSVCLMEPTPCMIYKSHMCSAFINISGHFVNIDVPAIRMSCSTNLVPQLMDQAFAALDLKKRTDPPPEHLGPE